MFIYSKSCMPTVPVLPSTRAGLPATWDEYYEFSRTQQAEYIDGLVMPSPLPRVEHNRVRLRVAQLLDELVTDDLRVTVSSAWREGCNVFVPDVMVYEAEDVSGEWYTGRPSLVVEVLDAQVSLDWVTKTLKYAESGVPQYWVVDPYQETVSILHLDGDHYLPSATFDAKYRGVLRVGEAEADALISSLFGP